MAFGTIVTSHIFSLKQHYELSVICSFANNFDIFFCLLFSLVDWQKLQTKKEF